MLFLKLLTVGSLILKSILSTNENSCSCYKQNNFKVTEGNYIRTIEQISRRSRNDATRARDSGQWRHENKLAQQTHTNITFVINATARTINNNYVTNIKVSEYYRKVNYATRHTQREKPTRKPKNMHVTHSWFTIVHCYPVFWRGNMFCFLFYFL